MNESAFLNEQLNYVKSQSYDVKFPALRFASGELIPISNEVPAGAETASYDTYEATGIARHIADYAQDFSNASVKAKRTYVPVQNYGSSYEYNFQEVRAVQLAGNNLPTRKWKRQKRLVCNA